MNREQAAREFRLRRRCGMSPERREALKAANTEARDWRAKCRICGAALVGTLETLKAHRCEV